ncbi:ATP-dependent nuclease [Ureibacillus sp. FSL W8-0352]|uniref:ATP-dependent nuclease n=1 Tax=Ureibacillus sp. FSL W8-0352 TaxID=2954596 RepID=UPI0030FBB38D
MKFKSIKIENFRNFDKACLNLNNKNIVFGRNDFGKTNFLYALRFLFDPTMRRNGFQITDYHKRNTEKKIIIQVELDISEENNDNNDFIRARVREATAFSNGTLIIQLEGEFDQDKQIGIPILKWGGVIDELSEIPQKGIFSLLDNIFEVVYIDPNISPIELFKKHKSLLYKESKTNKTDEIKKAIEELNKVISQDSRVQFINSQLTEKYNEIRKENVEIKLQSEHVVNGAFNHLTPYIHDKFLDENELYPTSGDGRQKILAYALTSLIEELKLKEKRDKRITIFLMEEIENSLHPSMQQIISRHLFVENRDLYPFLFVTTHSEHMFTYMDEVELIRIYKNPKGKVVNESTFFKIPEKFKNTRKIFNEKLSDALFYDKVLLVEGMSEKILFESIIEKLIYELDTVGTEIIEKIKILSIEGIGFEEYVNILKALSIKILIKTDNDIKKVQGQNKVSLLGIRRCQKISALLEDNEISDEDLAKPYEYTDVDDFDLLKNKIKREIYTQYSDKIESWRKKGIFLSEISLEEDLEAALPRNHLNELPFNLTSFLQESKKINMNEYVNKYLDIKTAEIIFNDERFKCLKKLVEVDDNDKDNRSKH